MSCPTCRKDGRRVSVWVPARRPRTARELAALEAAASASASEDQDHADPGRELAGRWESEPEWDEKIRLLPGRAGDRDLCPECGGPLRWEPGRTLVYCGPCNAIALPAAVTAHYERQAQRSAEVATRAAIQGKPDRAARARLRALKEQIRARADEWLETIADPDCYDRAQWQRKARELAAMLRGYFPEITDAGDESELAEIWQEISALITSEDGHALRAEYDESQARAARQYEAQQRTAELERAQLEAEAQAEREREAAERAARQAQVEQARAPKAITTGTRSRTTPARSPNAAALESIAVLIEESRQRKARELAEKGACEFKHFGTAVAARLYGVPGRDAVGRMTGLAVHGAPQYRACAKHFDAAEAQLNREGYPDVCYWDLPIQQQQTVTYQGGYPFGY